MSHFDREHINEYEAVEKAILSHQNDELISPFERSYAPPATPECASGI